MRIGLIVDGQAEYRSLALLYPRIDTSATIFNPLYADIQPHSSPTRIVRASLPAIRILARRGANRVVVCIDHEHRPECIPRWRDQLETALNLRCVEEGISDVRVALKAAMFENWLVSDTVAVGKKKARFKLTQAHVNQISPNKADSVNAGRILNPNPTNFLKREAG